MAVTWPLPWASVVGPAILVVLATGWSMSGPRSWAYIALDRASGLPGQSLMAVGPIVCLAAAGVAGRYVNRHSPLASPTLTRGGGQLGLRVLAVIAAGWGLSFLLASGGGLVWWQYRSTGGAAYGLELPAALLHLEFFIATGFLIGAVVARWHAMLWTLPWSALWVLVLPIEYTVQFPSRTTNLEYFLFPAVQASRHRDLVGPVVAAVMVWMLCVIAVLVLITKGWFALRARRTGSFLAVGSVAVVVLAGVGMALPAWLPTPFTDSAPPRLACVDEHPLQVCVTQAQRPVLTTLTTQAEHALARMGDHLPAGLRVVASTDAAPALISDGDAHESILEVSVGTNGLDDVDFRIGAALGGLDACQSGSAGASWAFAFASWLAPESQYALDRADPVFAAAGDEAVLDWYTANESALRTCSYDGPGPG